jgi:hypothetical protein
MHTADAQFTYTQQNSYAINWLTDTDEAIDSQKLVLPTTLTTGLPTQPKPNRSVANEQEERKQWLKFWIACLADICEIKRPTNCQSDKGQGNRITKFSAMRVKKSIRGVKISAFHSSNHPRTHYNYEHAHNHHHYHHQAHIIKVSQRDETGMDIKPTHQPNNPPKPKPACHTDSLTAGASPLGGAAHWSVPFRRLGVSLSNIARPSSTWHHNQQQSVPASMSVFACKPTVSFSSYLLRLTHCIEAEFGVRNVADRRVVSNT